jgi:hypothetical protein
VKLPSKPSGAWGEKSVEERFGGTKGSFYKKKFSKKIVVDAEGYGDVTTLHEALELAVEGTVIKLCEGVHICKTTIRKGGIKIEPYYKDKPAYLLGDEGPTIKIDVKLDNYQDPEEASRKLVILKRLVLTHNGEAIVKNFKEMQFPDFRIPEKPNVKCLKDMRIDPSMNTIVLIEHGALLIRDCLLTLTSLPKDLARNVPALVALPKTHLNVINSEFNGCHGIQTVGIVSMNAHSVVISTSRFKGFRGGAVYSVASEADTVKAKKATEFLIQDSQIDECQLMGIYL